MTIRRAFGLTERAQNLAQEPWRPTPDGMGWTKRNGQMVATVQLSPRGDGSFIVTSTLGAGLKSRRRQVPARGEAEALARAEAMKLELDGRAL